jgi:hypothetical protein
MPEPIVLMVTKVTNHVLAVWRPDWIGGDQVRYVEINGNKLTIKSAPFVFPQTGKEVVNTLTFEKVEYGDPERLR